MSEASQWSSESGPLEAQNSDSALGAAARTALDELAEVARGARDPLDLPSWEQGEFELLSELGPQALWEELTPPLCARHPDRALQWMRDRGLLVHWLPELDATVAFSQEAGRRHKDVWDHTKIVTLQAVPRPVVRWAAVLHDIGKVPTRRFVGRGRVTFHGHAEEGRRMFRRGPARRIAFPKEESERIAQLILFHLRPGQYKTDWTDSAVRRFSKEVGELRRDLLDLSRADVTSKRPGRRKHCLRMISELARRIRELEEQDNKPKALPPGLGHALMKDLGLPPGRHLAVLRDRLAEAVASDRLEPQREDAYYVAFVREQGWLDELAIELPRGRRIKREAGKGASRDSGPEGSAPE